MDYSSIICRHSPETNRFSQKYMYQFINNNLNIRLHFFILLYIDQILILKLSYCKFLFVHTSKKCRHNMSTLKTFINQYKTYLYILSRPMSCSNEQITTVHLHVNKYYLQYTNSQFMIISQIQFMKVWTILLLSCTRLCTYQPNLYSFDIQSTE